MSQLNQLSTPDIPEILGKKRIGESLEDDYEKDVLIESEIEREREEE